MGQSASRESASKLYEPKRPGVELAPELARELEESPDTDFTRRQYSAKYIEDRVAERLYQARVDAQARLRDARAALPVPGDDDDRSSLKVREDLQSITAQLDKRPKYGQLDSAGESARRALVSCFETHGDRVLDCRAELAAFEAEIASLEKRLAA